MQMARPQCDTPLFALGVLGCSHFALYYYGNRFGVFFFLLFSKMFQFVKLSLACL
jgi:hypothetical protein